MRRAQAAGWEHVRQRGSGVHRVNLWLNPRLNTQERSKIMSATGAEPLKLYEEDTQRWKDAALAITFPASGADGKSSK